MTVFLLANVGNRDLVLTDSSLLPEHDDPRWWHSVRRLGEEFRDNLARYADALELPLLSPTLEWLSNENAHELSTASTVLFASNQPEQYTQLDEWLKDTLPFAQAIRELIALRYGIRKRNIRVLEIEGNPADYANMLTCYLRSLPEIHAHMTADTHVYLEVSGGTPAMSSMLIVAGVEVFGERVHTLYIERNSRAPNSIGVAQQLFARKTRETLRNQIDLYAYTAALHTLRTSGHLVTSDDRERDLLANLLQYADRRLAFDFARARLALRDALPLTTGNKQAQISFWRRELDTRSAQANISELIHSAAIKLLLGDYADFVQRIFRFQEAGFRHLAEQMGLRYTKDDGMYADSNWLNSLPALGKSLDLYTDRLSGRVTTVDLGRPLNRYSLGAIVDYFIENDAAWEAYRTAVDHLHTFSAVAELRNKGLAGHGFNGIGLDDLQEKYGAPAGEMLDALRQIFYEMFGTSPGEDPYQAVNALLMDIIEAAS